MNNGPTSNSPYAGSSFVTQVDAPPDAFGMYVNKDDRSEYIELNRDGTFLQYERNAQFIGLYTLDQGVLRVAFSDGRTAQMFMRGNYFTDQQGRTWTKKERTQPYVPVPPIQPVSQPAHKPAINWTLCMVAVVTFLIVATQWSNLLKWVRNSSSRHYSESSASWEARTFPGTGMTVELPSDPDKNDVTLPSQEARHIKDMQVYGKEYDNLAYGVMYLLANGAGALDAEAGARGGMQEFKKQPGVVGLDYHITTSSSGRVSISGTCLYLDNVATVDGLVETRGSRVWMIFIISRTDDAEARTAARRIISSARFE